MENPTTIRKPIISQSGRICINPWTAERTFSKKVIFTGFFNFVSGLLMLCLTSRRAGIKVTVIINAAATPTAVKMPKFFMGTTLLAASEPKPAIVVTAASRTGIPTCLTVSFTISLCREGVRSFFALRISS